MYRCRLNCSRSNNELYDKLVRQYGMNDVNDAIVAALSSEEISNVLSELVARGTFELPQIQYYNRYTIILKKYKNMFQFKVLDEYWDSSAYCFCDADGNWIKTNYYSIAENKFNILYSYLPNDWKVDTNYYIYTDGPLGEFLGTIAGSNVYDFDIDFPEKFNRWAKKRQ